MRPRHRVLPHPPRRTAPSGQWLALVTAALLLLTAGLALVFVFLGRR